MNNRNYQKELDKIIDGLKGRPKLLIHSCCAPCSSYCLEYLCKYFEITVFYYNPNITEAKEYTMRVSEQKRLIEALNRDYNTDISFAEGIYDPEHYLESVRGLEDEPEGGKRCRVCFALRMDATAAYAKAHGFDIFTTTLTISPLKNADVLNETGEAAATKYGISFLPSDFKKRNGYKRSIELSREYDLYRQSFCGCEFSKTQAVVNSDNTN